MTLTPPFWFFLEQLSVNRPVFNILSLLTVRKLDFFSDNGLQLVIKHKILNKNINKLLLVVGHF